MFIDTISASKSDIIDQCLWRYYLKYVLRVPGYGSPNEESLNFGSFIHKVFELGYKLNDVKELLKLSEEYKQIYKIQFTMKDKTKSCIENFFRWNSRLGETISTEFPYEVDLDVANNIKANGVIDRVIKSKDGCYLVIDYKTSKKEKKKVDLLDNKQLMGYAYAISKKFDVPLSKIYCGHYYPVTGNFAGPVQYSKFQIVQWAKKEIERVWRIRKKTPEGFYPQKNMFCEWCEFQQLCEKYNSKEVVCKRLEEQLVLREQIKAEKALKSASK